MGSTFTEGAIQQHIAKLRNKMAELNVAPVPGPPRRGAVTNRPSGVYTQKSRAGPPPPPATSNRRRSNTVGRTPQGEEQEQTIGARRVGAKRKGRATQIKRSDSDAGESDEEFEGAEEDPEYAEQSSNKRKRGGRGGNGVQVPTRKVRKSNPNPGYDSKVAEIMESLRQADCRYDAQVAAVGGDIEHDDVEHSVEHTNGPTAHTQGVQFDYSQYAQTGQDQGEDEEEEDLDTNHPGAEFPLQIHCDFQYGQDDQVSPTSQVVSGSCLERAAGLISQPQQIAYHNFDDHAQHQLTYNMPQPVTVSPKTQFKEKLLTYRQMPQHNFTSDNQGNMDFGGWQPGLVSSNYSHSAMPPPQSPWPSTAVDMNSHQKSMVSTRNPSTISNYSIQGYDNGIMPSQTPALTGFGVQALSAAIHPGPEGAYDSTQNGHGSPQHQGFASALFMNRGDGAVDTPNFEYDFSDNKLFGDEFDNHFTFEESTSA